MAGVLGHLARARARSPAPADAPRSGVRGGAPRRTAHRALRRPPRPPPVTAASPRRGAAAPLSSAAMATEPASELEVADVARQRQPTAGGRRSPRPRPRAAPGPGDERSKASACTRGHPEVTWPTASSRSPASAAPTSGCAGDDGIDGEVVVERARRRCCASGRSSRPIARRAWAMPSPAGRYRRRRATGRAAPYRCARRRRRVRRRSAPARRRAARRDRGPGKKCVSPTRK